MVEASSAEEALKVLAETEYGASISELDGPHDYERLLSHEVQRIYDFFETISPNPDITRLFFLKYDFHNLKVLLKSRYLGRNNEEPLIAGEPSLGYSERGHRRKEIPGTALLYGQGCGGDRRGYGYQDGSSENRNNPGQGHVPAHI